MALTTCPNCHHHFNAETNTLRGVGKFLLFNSFRGPLAQVQDLGRVTCPNCGFDYHDLGIKLFWSITPRRIQSILIGVYLAILFLVFLQAYSHWNSK
jgi:hypothetical protein